MNIPSGWSNFNAPTNTTQFSHETNKLQRDGSNYLSGHTKNKRIIDAETFEMLRLMIERKKNFGQNRLISGLSPNIEDISKHFIGRQLPSELTALFLIHKNIVDNNRNFGYRGRLCYNCCSYWIDSVHNNKEEGMKSLMLEKSPMHECDAKKVLEISKCNIHDLASKKDQTYNGLSNFFTLMASSIILFGQTHLSVY